MKQPIVDKIHFASQKFREAIEETAGSKKVYVGWVVLEEDGVDILSSSGLTVGEDMEYEDLADALFLLNGRAYNMTHEIKHG
jgi:hypothetical protein